MQLCCQGKIIGLLKLNYHSFKLLCLPAVQYLPLQACRGLEAFQHNHYEYTTFIRTGNYQERETNRVK
jgi:hypothetical protein